MSARAIGRALVSATAALPDTIRDRVLARIAGSIGREARTAASLHPSKKQRAEWAAHVRLPVPIGLRAVHPTWIESALLDLPARARAALVGQGRDRATIWLARWASAAIPPMHKAFDARASMTGLAIDADDPIAAAIARSETDLLAWLHDVGSDQLAIVASAAGPEMLAAMIRRVPQLAIAAERIAKPPRAGKLGSTRAAIVRAKDLVGREIEANAIVRLGARAVAPHLDVFQRRQLAMRLPRTIGLVVEDELARHADHALDSVPAWAALAP